MGVRVPPFAPGFQRSDPSPALSTSALGSDARKTARLRIWRGNPWGFESPLSHQDFRGAILRLRSGSRLRARTPAKPRDLGSGGETHGGSRPPFRTRISYARSLDCAQER